MALDRHAYRKALEAELEQSHFKHHPFVARWARGEVPVPVLGLWAVQQTRAVAEFNRLLGHLATMAPDETARRHLLGNAREEELGTVPHSEYLLRLCEAGGVPRQRALTMELLPTTTMLIYYNRGLVLFDPWAVAVAGLLVGGEARIPGFYQTLVGPMRRIYGFTDHQVANMDIHIEADTRHGSDAIDMVVAHTRDEAEADQCVRKVREQGAVWGVYFDGIDRAGAVM